MVFYCFRNVHKSNGKSKFTVIGTGFEFPLEYGDDVQGNYDRKSMEKATHGVSSVFASGRNLVGSWILKQREKRNYRASFSVEASLVMSIILFSIMFLICYVYQVHDTVTGAMILEETVMKARVLCEEEPKYVWKMAKQAVSVGEMEHYGETLGNPRLWMGDYKVDTEIQNGMVSGVASAKDWKLEIEISKFQPAQFLNRYEALREIREELTDDGSGIPERNEPELYGDSSGDHAR